MSFTEFGLADAIVRAVVAQGYDKPTPIQQQAIPAVMSGGDLLAAAQTGTGKTAGFVLPMLHRFMSGHAPAKSGRAQIRALILTPTRELAAQVEESVRTYGANVPVTSMTIFGGVSINPQIKRLRRHVDIVVATPGRLLDHVQQGTIDLSQVEVLVLDEADRMLDMGFIRDIRKIIARLPAQRQNLLFSATFSDEIRSLANGLLDKPTVVEAATRNAAADTVGQTVHPVDRHRKRELLAHLIESNDWRQVLVFTRTKHGANRLAEQLDRDGIEAMAIHGGKSQNARTRALAAFKADKLRVLVATDLAARGIDIIELPHVVNYELPHVPEDYVHRIGRTGRAGSEGEAVSLVCVDEHRLLADIQKLLGRKVPATVIDGFEPDPRARPEPIQKGRGGRGGGGRHGGNGGGNRNARSQQPGGKPRGGDGAAKPARRRRRQGRSAGAA